MSTRPLKSRFPGTEEVEGAREAPAERSFIARVLLVALVAAVAIALWKAADVLLVAFGGVLLAVALRALADLVSRYTPLHKKQRCRWPSRRSSRCSRCWRGRSAKPSRHSWISSRGSCQRLS